MLFLLKDNLPPTTDRLPQIMCTNLLGYYSAEVTADFLTATIIKLLTKVSNSCAFSF